MNDSNLKTLTTEQLFNVIKEARDSNTLYLNNLDLTKCELRNIDFRDFTLENVIFSSHNPEEENPKVIFNVSSTKKK